MKLLLRTVLFFLAAATLAVAAPLTAHAMIERVVEKSFPVSAAGLLTAATAGGSITVQPGEGTRVHVIAREHIRAASEAEADGVLKDLTLTLEQHGNDVEAVAQYAKQAPGLHWGSWPPVEVDFVITVPPHYSANLKSAGGDITVGDLEGRFHLRTAGGNLALGHLVGEIEGATAGGGIVIAAGRGKVELSTAGGRIAADQLTGPADLRTAGGNIEVHAMAGPLIARTGGGGIGVEFSAPLSGESALATGGGGIRVGVPAKAAFRLDAATAGGEIETDGLNLTVDGGGRHSRRLSGAVNGGGPILKLRSSGGDLAVAPR
jgi:hypothetical protein